MTGLARPRGHRSSALRVLGAGISLVGSALVVALAVDDFDLNGWLLAFLSYQVMGGLLVWRQPRNRIGWWLLAVGSGLLLAAVVEQSPITELPVTAEALVQPVQVLGNLALIVTVTVFPSGHAETVAQRRLLRVVAAIAVVVVFAASTRSDPLPSGRSNPLGVTSLHGVDHWLMTDGFIIVPICLVWALVNMVMRWRRASGVERQQFRWLVTGCGVTVLTVATLTVTDFPWWALVVGMVGFNALPVTIAVAVSRYRLYDLDRIVSRSATYLVVTASVIGVYAVLVTTISRIAPRSSALAVTVATLGAAALFQPLLRIVRGFVDRRFNRARYDARATVDRFGETLRHEVDAHALETHLVGAVDQTLEPSRVRLWLSQEQR